MTETIELHPFGRIRDELILECPQDLYIPPEALRVILDAFEGPLDLLLYLIRRHNLDPLDIPMADLTRQYMEYVDAMKAANLELAAEYLVMAAMLIEIKSRLLLPRPPAEEGAEPEDPRAELVRRLFEYEQMKLAGRLIEAVPREGRDFHVACAFAEDAAKRLPQVSAGDIAEAWLWIVARAKTLKHHRVSRQELSVRAAMSRILDLLGHCEFAEFRELFDPREGVARLVVTFLAILELAREGLINLSQAEPEQPIYVRHRSA